MARTHARILVSIWNDPHFMALAGDEQRLYLLLLSQPDVSLCGALSLRPKRWARCCPTDTTESVRTTLNRLADEGYVLVDEEVGEVWLRTFIKYDGLLKVPNMVKAMWKQFDQLISEPIRDAFLEQFDKLVAEGMTKPRGEGVGVGEGGAARKMVERCGNCNRLTIDCVCASAPVIRMGASA